MGDLPPRWAIAANVVQVRAVGPGGAELRRGTKHFRPGAKVHAFGLYAGMCEHVAVVGRHRRTGRFVAMVVRAEHLERFRPALVYSPAELRLMAAFDLGGCVTLASRGEAEAWGRALPGWGRRRRPSPEVREAPEPPWWRPWAALAQRLARLVWRR